MCLVDVVILTLIFFLRLFRSIVWFGWLKIFETIPIVQTSKWMQTKPNESIELNGIQYSADCHIISNFELFFLSFSLRNSTNKLIVDDSFWVRGWLNECQLHATNKHRIAAFAVRRHSMRDAQNDFFLLFLWFRIEIQIDSRRKDPPQFNWIYCHIVAVAACSTCCCVLSSALFLDGSQIDKIWTARNGARNFNFNDMHLVLARLLELMLRKFMCCALCSARHQSTLITVHFGRRSMNEWHFFDA